MQLMHVGDAHEKEYENGYIEKSRKKFHNCDNSLQFNFQAESKHRNLRCCHDSFARSLLFRHPY